MPDSAAPPCHRSAGSRLPVWAHTAAPAALLPWAGCSEAGWSGDTCWPTLTKTPVTCPSVKATTTSSRLDSVSTACCSSSRTLRSRTESWVCAFKGELRRSASLAATSFCRPVRLLLPASSRIRRLRFSCSLSWSSTAETISCCASPRVRSRFSVFNSRRRVCSCDLAIELRELFALTFELSTYRGFVLGEDSPGQELFIEEVRTARFDSAKDRGLGVHSVADDAIDVDAK